MQKKRQIINIVNFIRDFEPRDFGITKEAMADTVRHQIELADKYGLKTTFLLQYDALIDPVYREMLLPLDPERYEIGLWHEVVEPQCKKAGIPWTGRFPWDWHCHCGFSVGYTKEQRRVLIDTSFETFKEIFGYYPRVFGAWLFDSETLSHISKKYGLDACCNCKEQYGTDGYTLWGGYYGGGYYPSKTNVFMPAASPEKQLDVPLFRMLGSDPVYQYDFSLDPESGAAALQGVVTLEPVNVYVGMGGSVPEWVDWYLKENFNGDCLSFGYAQAGQENSFVWNMTKDGLCDQYAKFAALMAEGKITVETLGETGRWFKETFKETPPSAITAHSAFGDEGKKSVWYCTKNYRINLYASDGAVRIRDFHVFDENVPDPYGDTVCTENAACYETLPVADGNIFSGKGVLSGVYFKRSDGSEFIAREMEFTDLGGGRAEVRFGELVFTLGEDKLEISAECDFTMENKIGKTDTPYLPTVESSSSDRVILSYYGAHYGIKLECGEFISETSVRSVGCKAVIVPMTAVK